MRVCCVQYGKRYIGMATIRCGREFANDCHEYVGRGVTEKSVDSMLIEF